MHRTRRLLALAAGTFGVFAAVAVPLPATAAPLGTITTIAGTGVDGSDGDGGLATQAALTPTDVTVDNAGNTYVADASAAKVRKIDPAGKITTFAGTGDYGSGDVNGIP